MLESFDALKLTGSRKLCASVTVRITEELEISRMTALTYCSELTLTRNRFSFEAVNVIHEGVTSRIMNWSYKRLLKGKDTFVTVCVLLTWYFNVFQVLIRVRYVTCKFVTWNSREIPLKIPGWREETIAGQIKPKERSAARLEGKSSRPKSGHQSSINQETVFKCH